MTRLLLIVSISLLAACAAPKVPKSEITVREVFAAQQDVNQRPADHAVANGDDLVGFTRSAQTELEQLFPKLPNPTLMLYVFPHRAGGLPIPGYMTALPMYPADPFVLPGEVSDASD